ncbi:hypothetical protein BSLG_005772 [Batrachochytrium salamandrivorans]|nr:hypothetical protein BSLG_005772 [Batrachochytrium salamandrivorans]
MHPTSCIPLDTCPDRRITGSFSDLEILAMYLAALIHDYDHPGVKPLLESLDRKPYKLFRANVVEMVLATDLTQHFSLLTTFKKKVVTGSNFDPVGSQEDRLTLMQMLMKCADVSNPAKPGHSIKNGLHVLQKSFSTNFTSIYDTKSSQQSWSIASATPHLPQQLQSRLPDLGASFDSSRSQSSIPLTPPNPVQHLPNAVNATSSPNLSAQILFPQQTFTTTSSGGGSSSASSIAMYTVSTRFKTKCYRRRISIRSFAVYGSSIGLTIPSIGEATSRSGAISSSVIATSPQTPCPIRDITLIRSILILQL